MEFIVQELVLKGVWSCAVTDSAQTQHCLRRTLNMPQTSLRSCETKKTPVELLCVSQHSKTPLKGDIAECMQDWFDFQAQDRFFSIPEPKTQMGKGWCLLPRLSTDLGSLWAALINLSPDLGYSEQAGQAGSQSHEVCAGWGCHTQVGTAEPWLCWCHPNFCGSPELRRVSL